MRYLYSVLFFVAIPLIVLRLLWKSIRFPVYRTRISERFALKPALKQPVDVWVHAVSLGEVIAASPLIEKLLEKNQRVMVTTTTPTGSVKIIDSFGDKIEHQFLPYDLMVLQRRFLRQIKPGKVIIIETELWPNLLTAVKRSNIPLLLMNARLSEKSMKGYQKIKAIIKPALACFTKILAQSEEDAKRFLILGAESTQVQVVGNIKFDRPPLSANDLTEIQEAVKHLGASKFIWLAASTHHNEEQLLLDTFTKLKAEIPELVLMVAPRHPERFQDIINLMQGSNFKTGTRSQSKEWNPDMDIIVLDSMGELSNFYFVSDLAFVGGSLVPIGGHNMLEPVQAGVPVICGNHLHNFQAISRDLLSADAMEIVNSPEELTEKVLSLYKNKKRRQEMADNAREVLESNRGALDIYLSFC